MDNCEYCIYYDQYLKTIEEKNNEIESLKKKIHNIQRTKLRLKNKLNFKIILLEQKLKEYDISDDWDVVDNDNDNDEQNKIKND